MNSPEMQKFEMKRMDEDLHGPRWFKPGSEFARIFSAQEGPNLLNTWIAPGTGSFIAGPQEEQTLREYIMAERTYTSAETADIKVRVIVPHPKYASMIPFGLIQAFAEIEPPVLQFENKEQVEVRHRKADIYTLKNGGCFLLIKITRSAVVQVLQPECRSLHDLMKLGELLDIARLERKLNS